jgi:hypothetical protein
MNGNTNNVRQARAAAVAAALSPRLKSKAPRSPTSLEPAIQLFAGSSLERYSIPEDDVLSLRSGVSSYRTHRREKVRDKKKKDLDDERERKLDDAMRMLQKDVQMKREALDRQEHNDLESIGSQTPRQMPPMEILRTPPITPPPLAPPSKYGMSSIAVIVDCPPSGPRRKPSSPRHSIRSQAGHTPSHSDSRPKTSNSQRTIFTNGPITPVSSAPSSPTKLQFSNLVKQPIPQFVSLPPNYPPPNPTPSQISRNSPPILAKSPEDQDRETRIAALEEQKWVLEQALRVLLNQQNGTTTRSPSPISGFMDRSPPKATVSPEQ